MSSSKGKAIIGICAVFLVSLIIWAVRTVPEGDRKEETLAPVKATTYRTNSLTEQKDGRTIWKLDAGSIDIDSSTNNAEMKDVHGTYYAENGRVIDIVARHGSYEDDSRNFKLDGEDGVTVKTDDGLVLTSRELEWMAKDSVLAAVGDAKLTKEEEAFLATADRIESSDGFSKVTMKGNGEKQAHIEKGDK